MPETALDLLHPVVDDGAIAAGQNGQTVVYVLEGLYAHAAAAQLALPAGALYSPPSGSTTPSPDCRVVSTDLQRKPAGYAHLRITCGPVTGDGGGAGGEKEPLSSYWEVRFTRVEKPLEALCGPSAGDPNVHELKYWQAETDPDLWDAFKYKDPKTKEEKTLSEASKTIAEKMKKGTTSYLRFVPTVTRTRIYDSPPGDIGSALGSMSAPSKFASTAKAWLVTGDDLTQDAGGKWTRVTAWQGAEAWDPDLYGTNAMKEGGSGGTGGGQ